MELEPGDVVEVNAAGTLPFGLSDGFQVRLVRVLVHDPGLGQDEHAARELRVDAPGHGHERAR
jgi:hypothetical protein